MFLNIVPFAENVLDPPISTNHDDSTHNEQFWEDFYLDINLEVIQQPAV